MNAGEADRSPFNRVWIPRDVRFVLDAFLATAIGTLGGLLVDSGFGLRSSVINFVYALLHPVFGLLADFPIAQLAVAEFVYRVPVVLMVGMLAGLVLRHVRYRSLLLWSIAVWPACLLSGTAAAFLVARKHAGDAATAIPRIGSFPELLIYVLQYLLLVAVILAAEAAVARAAGRTPAR